MDLLCPSCNKNDITWIGKIYPSNQFAGKFLDHLLYGGCLYKCNDCYLYFRWPRLPKSELDRLYKEGNPNNWQGEPRYRNDWKLAAAWLNSKFSHGSVLDVGCWDGGFLKYLGAGWQRYGVEINEIAIRRAEERGINIIGKNFDQFGQISGKFNAVVAFDLIEHTENPRYFLEQMARLTATNGVMIVSSGDTQAPSWKFMGSKYWYCTIAEHISFINERWCFDRAYALNLDIEHIKRFSHAGRNGALLRIILDLAKNTLYKFAPGTVGMLRAIGFGGVDVKKYKELKQYPPSWMSAKDHLIIFFRKR